MSSIVIRNLKKNYGKNTVIENLNLTIEDGLFTVLIGPSGCGKTTLLRMIAGIEPVTSGRIFFDGQDMTDVPPGDRQVAMVFQNYAIYPTMTVRGNIEFGLKNNKVPAKEREERIREVCDIVGLTEYLDRKPSQLSGGQRQRVALARAMVKKPKIFLMDEPLSNLDAKLRAQMRIELKELHRKLGTTFVYVTHDQVEAMSMADSIVLMEHGVIRQEAPPETMYADPQHIFAARFIGTPSMNLYPTSDGQLYYGFRPESGRLEQSPSEDFLSLPGEIIAREMLGSETNYQIETKLGRFMVKSTDAGIGEIGDTRYLNVDLEHMYFYAAEGYRIQPYFNNYGEYTDKIRRYLDEQYKLDAPPKERFSLE